MDFTYVLPHEMREDENGVYWTVKMVRMDFKYVLPHEMREDACFVAVKKIASNLDLKERGVR